MQEDFSGVILRTHVVSRGHPLTSASEPLLQVLLVFLPVAVLWVMVRLVLIEFIIIHTASVAVHELLLTRVDRLTEVTPSIRLVLLLFLTEKDSIILTLSSLLQQRRLLLLMILGQKPICKLVRVGQLARSFLVEVHLFLRGDGHLGTAVNSVTLLLLHL